MEFPEYIFEKITVGPLDVNCYVLGSKKDNTAIVIDAGGDPEKICVRKSTTFPYASF